MTRMRFGPWRVGLFWLVVLPTSLKALTSYPQSRSCFYFSTMGWTSTKLYNNKNNWIGDDANKKDWDISDFWNALMNNMNDDDDDDSKKKKERREEMKNNDNTPKKEIGYNQKRERPRRERRSSSSENRGGRPPSFTNTNNNNNRANYMEEEEQNYYFRQKEEDLEQQQQQQQFQVELEKEISRYRTRCQLLEHVVSEVRKNNTILTNRVQILQDAIETQKRNRQEIETKWNQTEAKLKLEYEQDCTQLMDLLDQEKNLRTKVKADYRLLQEDLKKSQDQVKEQKQIIQQMEEEQNEAEVYDEEEILKLRQQINRWKAKWEKEEKLRLQEKESLMNNNNNNSTTTAVLKEKIIQMQTELQDIQKTFHVREEIYKKTILSSKDQISTIQKKLDDIFKERNELSQLVTNLQSELSKDKAKRDELEEMITAMLSKENSDLVNATISEVKGDDRSETNVYNNNNVNQTKELMEEQNYEESMEIAKASVRAAEEREVRWKQEVEVLQGKIDKLVNDNEQLNDIKSLLEEKVELQEESFVEKLNEANQKRDDVVRQLQSENQNLIQSFEEERETLMMGFTASNEEWKVKLNEIQRKYDQDIVRLKSELFQKKDPTIEEEYKTKFDDVGIALDFIPSSDDTNNEVNKKKGKWRRFLGRLKKPFQKPR